MNTAVVILNFNGQQHLAKFLPPLIEFTNDASLWVADNGSSDDSIKFIEKEFPQINILKLEQNYGFAGGYNKALKKIKAEYYVLLNSDVEVVENWLPPLIKVLVDNQNVSAVQPKILSYFKKNSFEYAGAAGGFLDKWAYPFCRGRIFDTCELDEGQYNKSMEIFWASGACFVVKSKVFNDLGGFDDRFFAHMEEIDLCWRMHNEGWTVKYEPSSHVFHVGGGTLDKSNPQKTYLNYRNSLATILKNLPKNQLISVIIIRLILDGISGVKFMLSGKFRDVFAIIRAHFAFYAMAPSLMKERKGSKRSSAKLYGKSIVWAYFIKNIRIFSKLDHE